jgi:hypothetical protein
MTNLFYHDQLTGGLEEPTPFNILRDIVSERQTGGNGSYYNESGISKIKKPR